jgi:AmmeMemoRadiSam system protein A
MTEAHPLVILARESIEAHVRDSIVIAAPEELTPEMQRRAGAFVTLHRHGKLRGCIGTIQPVRDSLAEEVIHNAVSAATRDPRFPPLRQDELQGLDIKVDVLNEPEEIESEADLDPKRYGLIVQSKAEPWKRGLLLPNLEGIDSIDKQVYWTRHHKAGITNPDEPVQMFRFEVIRLT